MQHHTERMNDAVITKLSGLLESEEFMRELAEEIVAVEEHSTGGSDGEDKIEDEDVEEYGREAEEDEDIDEEANEEAEDEDDDDVFDDGAELKAEDEDEELE